MQRKKEQSFQLESEQFRIQKSNEWVTDSSRFMLRYTFLNNTNFSINKTQREILLQ